MGGAGLGGTKCIGHVYGLAILVKGQFPCHRLGNSDGTGRKVDVLPLERQQFADAHTGKQQRGDDGIHDGVVLRCSQHRFALCDGNDLFLRLRVLRLPGQLCTPCGVGRCQRHFHGVVIQLDQNAAHQ